MIKKADYSLKSKRAFGLIIPLVFLILVTLFLISLPRWTIIVTVILGVLALNALLGIILGFRMHQAKRRACQVIADALGDKGGGAVLDVGAGTGILTIHLAKEGFQAVGVDIDGESLDRARKNAEIEKVSAEFRVGDGSSLEWPDSSFKGVTSLNLLHEVKDPKIVLAESYRVLKPEGTLAMADFRRGLATFSIFWVGFFKFLSRKTLLRLLQETGFGEIQITKPTVFHQLIFARKGGDSTG